MKKEKKQSKLFYIVFPFMTRDLNLSGIRKEVFAIFFGFWRKEKKFVPATYSTIREMTGATDPSISNAIKALKDANLIEVHDQGKGLGTLYRVTLPPRILEEFEAEYLAAESGHPQKEVKGSLPKVGVPNRQTVPPSASYDNAENTIP